MRSTIGVATCARAPDLDDDWPLLAAELEQRGAATAALAWTDPSADWAAFDLVVIRGTWDYFGQLAEYRAWVERVAAVTRLVNPAPVVNWNLDKRYLVDLADDGVPVVATSFLTAPGGLSEWEPPAGEFVVKPAVSAGGFETARYRPSDAAAAREHVARLLRAESTVMVQPYLASVDREGETAMIYLGGRYSHAINKGALLRAGAGIEERLWEREKITLMEPSAGQCRVADTALASVARRTGCPMLTYARVDLLTDAHGSPVVSEVELVEPGLFLRYAPGSVERFADVLVANLP